jgi:hypothetical protein
LDAAELLAGLLVLAEDGSSSASSSDRVVRVFELYDRDGDGFIDGGEMLRCLRAVFRAIEHRNPIGFHRATRGATPEQVAEATTRAAFSEADTNADGRISLPEFRRWFGNSMDRTQAAIAILAEDAELGMDGAGTNLGMDGAGTDFGGEDGEDRGDDDGASTPPLEAASFALSQSGKGGGGRVRVAGVARNGAG